MPTEQSPYYQEIVNSLPESWNFEGRETTMGMIQDHYETAAGCKCIVSKNFPPGLDGWHISIGPRGRRSVSDEVLQQEVSQLLTKLDYPFVFTWKSPKTGALNYHQDIWGSEEQGDS